MPDAGTPTAPAVAIAPVAAPAPPPSITATPLPAPAAPIATPLPADPAVPPVNGAAIAAPTVTVESPEPVVAVTTEQKGLFLQLGAFGSQGNAESYLARLRTQVEWLAPALHVYPKDGLYRVHAGPYANQAEARATAERLSQALGIKPMVLTR